MPFSPLGKGFLTGRIDESYAETISTVQAQYSEVMDLTRKEEVELPDDKLVLMNIKIAEFNKSATDNLGINWTNSFAGPAAMKISTSNWYGAKFRYPMFLIMASLVIISVTSP